MTRKVIFPLKLKIILLFSLLLAGGLALYSYSAIDLFKRDKTAYVYESSLNGLDFLDARLEQKAEELQNRLSIIKTTIASERSHEEKIKALANFFQKDEEFLAYQSFSLSPEEEASDPQKKFQWHQKNSFEQYGIYPKDFFANLKGVVAQYLNEPPLSTQIFVNSLNDFEMGIPPHLFVISPQEKDDQIILHFLLADFSSFLKSMEQQKVFRYFIRDGENNTISIDPVHGEDKKTPTAIFQKLEGSTQDLPRGVKQVSSPQGKFLVGFKRLENLNLKLYSLIPYDRAFAAADFLAKQSLYFGGFVLALIVIIGIFFSRSLTKQLERLHQGTQKLAEGDFASRVDVKTHDEIGALGDSFNFMSSEILRYMEEMKEKQRLQNELKVAQLVQDTFFPPFEVQSGPVQISSFYEPATECGGDWWGHIEREGKSLIFIADATGHGVPAAFLTATVHSCVKTLDILTENQPQILESPAKVMSILNQAVFNVGKDIYLTSFIGILDHQTLNFSYTNASHLEPFILRTKGKEELTKSDLIPLLEGKGPRLGHKQEATFEEQHCQLVSEDAIIMWTDGITECASPEGKQWGQRKLIKSLLAYGKGSSQKMRDGVMIDLEEHRQGQESEDDLTLVIAKV